MRVPPPPTRRPSGPSIGSVIWSLIKRLPFVLLVMFLVTLYEAWALTVSFGVVHSELGWQRHPGYWSCFWLAIALPWIATVVFGTFLVALHSIRNAVR